MRSVVVDGRADFQAVAVGRSKDGRKSIDIEPYVLYLAAAFFQAR